MEPSPHAIDIFERGTDMKLTNILILPILSALLGGCVIAPAGYGDNRDGYYRERGYNRGNGNYRDRNYNRRDGNYREYDYRGQEDAYRDHGG
jgi:hypothetical protein